MTRKLLIGAAAGALFLFTLGIANAVAAPVPLNLPQGTAFSILGASCGGIQETSSATGFDPVSGYPTGVVLMSTRCGGSGRGGGYHTTLYTASANVTWDFTAAVVSYSVPGSAGTDSTFTAYDAYGNEVYNQGGYAYLLLAPGFVPAPRVTGITPVTGPASGGTKVTITGTGFTGASGVSFGGSVASFTVASSTSISATAPARAGGTVDVTVTNAGGASRTSSADRFTYVPAPAVTALSPATGPAAGGTVVTLTGANFTGATRVAFGSIATGFTVNSDSSITATAPTAEAAGSVYVTVTTVGGKSATGAASRFTYTAATPVVAALDPSTGSSDGGTTVTVSGANFTGASAVTFGGVRASFYVDSDTSIVAYSPPGAGTVDVRVTSFQRTSALSSGDRFTYAAPPVVSSIDPTSGPVDGGTTVEITGTGFTDASEVDFGGAPADFVVNDDTSITATAPPSYAGTVDVTITASGGTSAPSSGDQFTYLAPPVVDGLDTTGGPVDGGTTVTIWGSGFTGATEVDFGGVPADFVVLDDNSITVTSPPGDAGTVDVTVTTPLGTSPIGPGDQFTYG